MPATSEPTLTEIARELYVLAPSEFIPARDARAKQMESAALAAQVRALRKPLVAAWIVNLFARECAHELGEALRLADDLREAQADLDARALSALGRQRRTLTRTLADRAAGLAVERGEQVTASTRDAVEQTLTAAMFHAESAAAVASGRLIRPLEASGDDARAAQDAVAGELDVAGVLTERPVDEIRARRERREIERAVREAEKAAQRAEKERDEADSRLHGADERARTLSKQEKGLETELARVRDELDTLRAQRAELDAARTAALESARVARQAADDERARLDS
ncbi:MAG: transposase [Actinomycetota bacterium]